MSMQSITINIDGSAITLLVAEDQFEKACKFLQDTINVREDVSRFIHEMQKRYDEYVKSAEVMGWPVCDFQTYLAHARANIDKQIVSDYQEDQKPVVPQAKPETRSMFGMFKAGPAELTTGPGEKQ